MFKRLFYVMQMDVITVCVCVCFVVIFVLSKVMYVINIALLSFAFSSSSLILTVCNKDADLNVVNWTELTDWFYPGYVIQMLAYSFINSHLSTSGLATKYHGAESLLINKYT